MGEVESFQKLLVGFAGGESGRQEARWDSALFKKFTTASTDAVVKASLAEEKSKLSSRPIRVVVVSLIVGGGLGFTVSGTGSSEQSHSML